MTKYIFLPVSAYGHVNPTLAIAQELVKRGQEVVYYLTEEFRAVVQGTGAAFHSYTSKLHEVSSMATPERISSGLSGGGLPWLLINESLHVLPQVLDSIRTEQPDVIVYDVMCIWPTIAIQVLNIPGIALHATHVFNEHVNEWTKQEMPGNPPPDIEGIMAVIGVDEARLREMYNVPSFNFFEAIMRPAALNIVFLPQAFQVAGDTFAENYLFVGPSLLARHEVSDFPFDKLRDDLPLLYISLGTLFNEQLEFFKMCFECFAGQPWQVVLSRGKQIDPAALGPVPDNFLISTYVPQLEILPRTQVFITHAGPNSIMESLYYGVPMVAIPQMIADKVSSRRVEEMGLGIVLEKEMLTVSTLRAAVARVIDEVSFQEHVQQMRKMARESGGYSRAADAIIQFTQKHATL